MIIRVGMAPRCSGMSLVEFQRHWREEHSAVAERLPGLRGYVQNHAVLDDSARPLLPHPGFDACAETAFDDLAAMDAAFASPAYQTDVRADESLLIDRSRFSLLLCERLVLDAGGGDGEGVKLMTFLRAHPIADRQKVLALVRGPYAELARSAGALRHVLLIPSPDLHAGRQAPACDLVDCVWFTTTRAALDFVTGPATEAVDDLFSGRVFGRERLLAVPRVVRDVPA